MRKNISLVFVALLLSACSNNESEVTEALKKRLKDPNSLQITDSIFSEEVKEVSTLPWQIACVEYNAKNSFGGYGGPSIALARKVEGSVWKIENMNAIGCVSRIARANERAALIERMTNK